MRNTTTPVYTETQSLKIPAVRIILFVATVFALSTFAWELYSEWSVDALLAGLPMVLILAAVWWLIESSRIYMQITGEGISYRFHPLQFRKRFARWKELKEVYLREYSALGEFGGWGLRLGFKGSWGYVAKGKSGLQLIYKNGKKRFISIQRPQELQAWLEQYAPANTTGPESR